MKRKIYVCGPMRNRPYFNFPAFFAAEDRLRRAGWEVLNPAQFDAGEGVDWEDNPTGVLPQGFDVKETAKRDLDALLSCDAIYLLRGWSRSMGAQAEHAVARWCGLEILGDGR